MKNGKRLLAFLLGISLLWGCLAIPAAAADSAITADRRVLSFEGASLGTDFKLPQGMSWQNAYYPENTYDGTRKIVELSDGTKALQLDFDKATESSTGNKVSGRMSVAFTVSVPEAYKPYMTGFKVDFTNNAKKFGTWSSEDNVYQVMGITDGTAYGKTDSGSGNITSTGRLTVQKAFASMKYIPSGWNFWDNTSTTTTWTTEQIKNITELVIIFSVPTCTGEEGWNIQISSIDLVLSATAQELASADEQVENDLFTITNFESYSSLSEIGTGVFDWNRNYVNMSLSDDRAYASDGAKAVKYQSLSSGTDYNGYIRIPLDSRKRSYDGVSFWLRNSGNAGTTFKLRLYLLGTGSDGKEVAKYQKVSVITAGDEYVKYTVWFDDVGVYSGSETSGGETSTGTSIPDSERETLTAIRIRMPGVTASHPGVYFDDIRYITKEEVIKSANLLNIAGAALPENVSVSTLNSDISNMKDYDGVYEVTDDAIRYNFTGTNPGNIFGYRTVINLEEGSMAGAKEILLNLNNTSSTAVQVGVVLRGTNDDGAAAYWKWGENKDSFSVAASNEISKAWNLSAYTNEQTDDYYIGNYKAANNSYPTAAELRSITSMEIYVWASAEALAGTYLDISSVTVNYKTFTITKAANMSAKCSVTADSTAFYTNQTAAFTVTPDAGYVLVPGSLELRDPAGNVLDTPVREGFRKNNIGLRYAMPMPDSNVTVYADVAPAGSIDEPLASFDGVDIDTEKTGLRFQYTLALNKDGTLNIFGESCEVLSYGILVTTAGNLERYGYDQTDLTSELAETDHHIAANIRDIKVSSEGLKYDESHTGVTFSVLISELAAENRGIEFVSRAYVVYNQGGSQEVYYIDADSGCYNEILFGPYATESPSFAKGINISSAFEQELSDKTGGNVALLDETYANIRSCGFDHVRLAVGFARNTDDSTSDYRLNEDFMKYLDTAVDLALRNDLTIVLDSHTFAGINSDVDSNKAKFLKIWEQLSERYAGYPGRVVFELINEPNGDASGVAPLTDARLNEIQNEAVALVRQKNPARKIVVTVNSNSIANKLSALNVATGDTNIVISVHNYSSMAFTHQGATWAGYPDTQVDFTASVQTEIYNGLKKASDYQTSSGRKVWISEFGVYLGIADHSDVSEYLSYFTSACEALSLDWCYWEYNVGFGAYDSAAGAWKDYVVNGLLG